MLSLAISLAQVVAHVAVVTVATVVLAETTIISNLKKILIFTAGSRKEPAFLLRRLICGLSS